MFFKQKSILFLLALLPSVVCYTFCSGQLTKPQIDSLVVELSKAREDTNKVILLMKIGNEVGYEDPAKALQYAREGFELSEKLNYVRGMGRTAYLMGGSYIEMGKLDLGDSCLTVAEGYFTQLNDKSALAKIPNTRGMRHYMMGNYYLAADQFSKAAAAFDGLKDTMSSLTAYTNLIAVLGQINNRDRAVDLGKKVLKISEQLKDSLQIGYTLQGLVNNLIYLNKLEEAAGYIERLYRFANSTADQGLAAECFSTLGTYYYKKEDYITATRHFTVAVQKANEMGNNYQLANHLNSVGQAYYRQREFTKAREQLLRGMQIAKATQNKRAESNIAASLSSLYDSLGDYNNAYKSLLTHTLIKDSLLNSETRNYTTQLEAQYETNKKENEILRLQQVEQEKDFEIKRRNTYLAIGTGLIALLILILYLIRRNHRNKQKLSQQQAALLQEKIKTIEKEQQISSLQSMINGQETERTRIAKDLHDGLGGLFSTVKMHYSVLQKDTPAVKENPLYKKTMDLINNASDELRKVAHNMMPEVLMKVGLAEALQDFCNNISSGKLLKVTLQTFGMENRLSRSTEIMLYRIIQELVNNIIKHAYATEAIIQINRDGNRLSLTIEDNGRGFDTREAEEKRSMGMATVRSRVDYLNGRITIDSRKDVGTTVMIDLLLNEN
jgi:signal transduction histidine kinase